MGRPSALLILSLLAACDVGGGSRVQPFLPGMPSQLLAGVVRDPDGKPIAGALVRLAGSSRAVATARNGRFVFPNPPTGRVLMTVDGSAATADGTDAFDVLGVRVDVRGGRTDLDRPIVLADKAAGTSATVTLGVQPGPVTVDGSARSGAILTIGAGTLVSVGGNAQGSTSINLSSAGNESAPAPLPPSPDGTPRLATRLVWIHPTDLELTSGARLSIPNDFAQAPNGQASMVRYDPGTGTWTTVTPATVDMTGARIEMDAANLPGGGLYAFTGAASQTTFLTGRVLDAAKNPIGEATVTATGGVSTRADANGNFQLGPLPAVDAASAALDLEVVAQPPRRWSPVTFRGTFTAVPGQTVAGDLTIDTFRSGLLRVLVAQRGRAEAQRRVEFGGQLGTTGTRLTGRDGQLSFREIAAGWAAAYASWSDGKDLFRGFGRADLREQDENLDLRVLVRREDPRPTEFRGRLIAIVLDERFATPLEDAIVQGRNDPTTGDQGETDERGELLANGERFGDVTASYESTAGGTTVHSAYTLAHLDNGRAEFPLRTARSQGPGTFDAHGLLAGRMQLTTPAKERKLVVRPRYRTNDFWHRVLTGETFAGDLPRRDDPETTGATTYAVGLPLVSASVAAVEGRTTAGAFVPERLGVLVDLGSENGVAIACDVSLDHVLSSALTLQGVLAGLDAGLAVSSLRYDLGAERPDGSALDLLQGAGGVTAAGSDAMVLVPTGTGVLQGATWLVALTASGSAGGAQASQSILTAGGAPAVSPGTFLALPRITSPAPGSTSGSATEVVVTWDAPPGTDFFELELASVQSDTRVWRVILPGFRTSFPFRRLVKEATQILVPGRTWTLRLSAYRLTSGIGFDRSDGYQRLVGNVYSLRLGERGVGMRSTWEHTFQTP